MQFAIIAKDGTDTEALKRRLKVRDAHIRNTDENMDHMVMAAATLNNEGDMNGSIMIVEFPSRQDLDDWLNTEPYVTGDVWRDITVLPCKVGPSFSK